jgi:molybdopterin molybdotransferase
MVPPADAPLSPISVQEHRDRILGAIRPLAPVESPLEDTLGRVLASDVAAVVDVPGFDNSAMDGYAVNREDVAHATEYSPVDLAVVADLPAGSAENPALGPGQAARIMTGAAVPDDADCIVPVEDTDGGTRRVRILRAPAPAAHIRRTGTDVRAREAVLTAGRTLNSRDLAAAAATGSRNLLVHPAPRVGVLSTGTELVALGGSLHRGQIHDSNSTLLAAMVAECGGTPVQIGSVPDDEAALRAVLREYAPRVDAFITSGGVSVGAYDVVKAVLAPLGVWFGPVRMQPGKPQGFGEWPGDVASGTAGTPIFTLPGNPVSVFVSFEAFVRPALLAMQGRTDVLRTTVQAVATEGWQSPNGRMQFMPAVLDPRPESGASAAFSVRPASSGGSGSYLVASLARANALAIVPEEVSEVREGDLVAVTLVS